MLWKICFTRSKFEGEYDEEREGNDEYRPAESGSLGAIGDEDAHTVANPDLLNKQRQAREVFGTMMARCTAVRARQSPRKKSERDEHLPQLALERLDQIPFVVYVGANGSYTGLTPGCIWLWANSGADGVVGVIGGDWAFWGCTTSGYRI